MGEVGYRFPMCGGGFGFLQAPRKFLPRGAVPSLLRPQTCKPWSGSFSSPCTLYPQPWAQPIFPEDQAGPPGTGPSRPKPPALLWIWSFWGQVAPPGFALALSPCSKLFYPLPSHHGKIRGGGYDVIKCIKPSGVDSGGGRRKGRVWPLLGTRQGSGVKGWFTVFSGV